MQRIERVEELFLRALLACKKLNIVDQQHIDMSGSLSRNEVILS